MTEPRPVPSIAAAVPPGPLAWLYPELGGWERRQRADARALHDVLRAPPPRLRLPRGPRAAAARRALMQRLRGRGACAIEIDPALPSLEVFLSDACRDLAPGRTLLVSTGLPASATLDVALARRRAAAPDPQRLWLLPLLPGATLEAQLEAALAVVARDRAAFADAALIPFFVTDPSHPVAPVETRLPATFWGLLPGDRYPARVRDLTRRLVAALHPHRFPAFVAHESHALGGFDPYLESLLGRTARVASAPAARRPLLLAFCGIDGSGKSTHLAALRDWLGARGLRVAAHKIYRHGLFHDTVTDIARQCAGGHHLHLWRMERIAKLFDSVKCFDAVARDMASHDVVLFDRGTWTHAAAGTGRSHHDPYSREMLAMFPTPHRTFLLDIAVERALARIAERPARTIDENPYMLGRYRAVLGDLARQHGFLVLDSAVAFAVNQDRIRAEVAALLA